MCRDQERGCNNHLLAVRRKENTIDVATVRRKETTIDVTTVKRKEATIDFAVKHKEAIHQPYGGKLEPFLVV